MNISAIRSKHASVSLLRLQTGIDQHIVLLRRFENWTKRGEQAVDRAFRVDGLGSRVQRADLDRHVRPRYRAEMIALKPLLSRPARDLSRKLVNEIEITLLINVGFDVAQARFAEQIDAEADASIPQLAQARKRLACIASGDKFFRHRLD